MTVAEYKNAVMIRFKEGQEVDIKIKEDGRVGLVSIRCKIDKFYPNHVTVQRIGYIESFSYYEFHNNATPAKKEKIKIPEKVSNVRR